MSFLRFSLFPLGAIALAACSGGTAPLTGGSSGSGAATNVQSFTDDFCSSMESCCTSAGRTLNATLCGKVVAQANKGKTYDPATGSSCLAETKTAVSTAGFCTGETPVATPSCAKVFQRPSGGAAGGGKAPGESCQESDECADSAEGESTCAIGSAESGAEVRICQVALRGKVNEGPCLATRREAASSYAYATSGPPVARAYFCFVDDGLFCDDTTKKCASIGTVGSPCTNPYDAYACGEKGYCDGEAKKCLAAAAEGAACATDEQCESRTCTSGRCTKKKSEGGAMVYCN